METKDNCYLRIIDPEQALNRAQKIIENEGLKEWEDCELLKDPKVKPQQPFKVSREPGDAGAEPTLFYIVPYGIEGDHDKDGTPLTRLCILLDAESGEFEEVVAFGQPVAYLSQGAAIQVVACALGIPPSRIDSNNATLIFKAGEISHVRAYPFWKVVVEGRAYYVDQKGKLYGHLSRGKLGS